MTFNMGLSARLVGAFAIVALLIIGMAAVTISIGAGIGEKSHQMSEVQTPLTVDTVVLSGDLVRSVSKLREYLLTGEKSAQKAALASWTAIDADVAHIKKNVVHTNNDDMQKRVESIVQSIESLRIAEKKLLKIAFTPDAEPARQLMDSKVEPVFATALQSMSRIIDAEMTLDTGVDRKQLLKNMTDARLFFANATAHLRVSSTTGSKKHSASYGEAWKAFGQMISELESKAHLFTSEQAALFANLKQTVQKIGDQPNQVIEIRQSDNWNVPATIMREEVRPILEGILDIVDGKVQSNGLRQGGIKDVQLKLLRNDSRGVSESIDFLAIAQWTAVAIGLIFCIAIWMFCNHYIVTPIVQLTGVMKALASGDREIDIPMTGRHDEVGDMANALVTFKEQAIEKARIEAEADKERALVEAERRRHEEAQEHAIRSVGDALGRLSGGDLTVRVKADVAEEYVKLKSDFNAAVERLESVISNVISGADGIMSGTTEIAQAADDLSRRTENQAATLEETAAAVAEITANVSKSSDGANRAQDVVSTSKVEAERGGAIVGQAIESMADIEQSSKEIGDIIGVIDEIAFQTNLLALNAGVEAARAGEAGRGFAVVASEVRALAQRAATAARQIKELISTSTEQVGRGVELVKATGTALEQIVTGVNEINTLVGEIASSAHEQAGGLQQINTAVNQLDQVTQENAAMVEESTAAARTLANQTEELTTLVGQFSVAQKNGKKSGQAVGNSPSRSARPSREKIIAKQPIERRPMINEDVPVGAIANGALNHHAAAVNGHADAGWEEF